MESDSAAEPLLQPPAAVPRFRLPQVLQISVFQRGRAEKWGRGGWESRWCTFFKVPLSPFFLLLISVLGGTGCNTGGDNSLLCI